MLARYAISTLSAIVVALGLFYLMQALLSSDDPALSDTEGGRMIDFVRLKRETVFETRSREIPEKPEMVAEPTRPSLSVSNEAVGPPPPVDTMTTLNPSSFASYGGPHLMGGGPQLGAAPSDAVKVPLMRVNPMYPREAAERRLEGYVVVQFTIDKTGAVKNPEVVDSKPRGVFERAALSAIRKWKYKPTIENGKPIETPGETVKLTFELDE